MMLSGTHNLHMMLLQALLEPVLALRTMFRRFRVAKKGAFEPLKAS